MILQTNQLNTFKELYRQYYGVILSDEKAFDEMSKLFELYKAVYLNNQHEKYI